MGAEILSDLEKNRPFDVTYWPVMTPSVVLIPREYLLVFQTF